jgi:hypothetical protein
LQENLLELRNVSCAQPTSLVRRPNERPFKSSRSCFRFDVVHSTNSGFVEIIQFSQSFLMYDYDRSWPVGFMCIPIKTSSFPGRLSLPARPDVYFIRSISPIASAVLYSFSPFSFR